MQLTIEIATEPAAKTLVCAIAAYCITAVVNGEGSNEAAPAAIAAIVFISIITQVALARNKATGKANCNNNNRSNRGRSGQRNNFIRAPVRQPRQDDNVVPLIDNRA